MCGAAWAASTTTIAPCACAQAASRGTGTIVPSELLTAAQASTFGAPARQERVEVVQLELALGVHRDDRELGTGSPCDVLPGDEVRVVLELGDEHEVAGPEVVESPA